MTDQHPFDVQMAHPLDYWTLIDDAEDGSNKPILTLCLGANFYFDDGDTAAKRQALGQLVDGLQAIYGDKLAWDLDKRPRVKKYKKFSAQEALAQIPLTHEYSRALASDDPETADEWRISWYGIASWDPNRDASKFSFRLPACSDQLGRFTLLFETACKHLQPIHAFGGIIAATCWDKESWNPQEYALSNEFYGVLVGVSDFLLEAKKGILSPTWLLALNDDWYAKLDGDAGLQAHGLTSDVRVSAYPGGVILQAGEYPDPLPIEKGLPEFWRRYNAWLKPIRNPETDSLHCRTLSEEQYFDRVTTRMWYERMDEGAVWPPTSDAYEAVFQRMEAERLAAEQATAPPPLSPSKNSPLAAHGDTLCPKTGWWICPNWGRKVIHLNEGEKMPGGTHTQQGAVIWYYRDDQSATEL